MSYKNDNIKYKSAKIVDNMFMKIFKFFQYMNTQKTINYFKFNEGERCLEIDYSGKKKLYALKLETKSNITAEIEDFSTFVNDIKYEQEAGVLLSYVQHDNIQGIYIFTFSSKIASLFSVAFGISLLKPTNIVSALYHIFLIRNTSIIDKHTVELNALKQTEPTDFLYKKFPSIISMASNRILKEYTSYQAISFQSTPIFNPVLFFKEDWDGVFHLFFDFSIDKTKRQLQMYKNIAKLGDAEFTKQYNDFMENEDNKDSIVYLQQNCFVANCIFYLKDRNTATKLQSLLKINAVERYINMDKILPRTLLLTRDIDMDYILDDRNCGKYFKTSHQQDCIKNYKDSGRYVEPDFYGEDINGNFMNYMFKKNQSPHGLLFGTTGAGKSVAALKIMAQIIGYDFDTKKVSHMSNRRKIRYLNVGYTGGRIVKDIKEDRPDEVEIIPSTVDKLRFSLFEFDDLNNITKEERDFFVAFINLVLEVSSQDNNRTLNSAEEKNLLFCLERMIQINKYPRLPLYEIKEFGGYDDIIDEIFTKYPDQYDLNTEADELPEEYRKRFDLPTLADLINFITQESKIQSYTEQEKDVFISLKQKIEGIASVQIFNQFSNVTIKKRKNFYYSEFDKIKENKKDFIAIGWLLLKNWYKEDKLESIKQLNEGKKNPDSFYFIEEAHNFLNIPIFEKMIDVFSREVRKYGIHLILISQNASDVSPTMTDLYKTIIFIFKEQDKPQVKKSLRSVFQLRENEELDSGLLNILDNIKNPPKGDNRTLFIKHDDGASACLLDELAPHRHMFDLFDLDTMQVVDQSEEVFDDNPQGNADAEVI